MTTQPDELKKNNQKRISKNAAKLVAGTFSAFMDEKFKSTETGINSIFSPNDLPISNSFSKSSSTNNFPIFGASAIQKILYSIQSMGKQIVNAQYPSMREYRELKESSSLFLEEVHRQIFKFKKLYSKELDVKRRKKTIELSLINDQLKLIGSCVKSEHFKDFYSAKSYISL